MSGVIWTKFFWSDWESDPALRLCSLAAQGLWMRMLCIAAAHDPIGYVAVAGRGLDETALARMTGCPESEVAALLGELDKNGVFSRDRHGRIFSRRMVNDAKKSAIARKNGKFGGNPNLGNKRENSTSDNRRDKPQVKPQEPEARSQKPDKELFSESENLSGGGSGEPRQMAFVGKVIRLTFADFERWRSSYSAIPDIRAELEAADAYYADNQPKDGKWFFPVSNWLKRENNRHLQQEREERGSRATWN